MGKKARDGGFTAADWAFGLVGLAIFISLVWLGEGPEAAPPKGGWIIGVAFLGWGVLGRVLALQNMKTMRKAYEQKARIDEGTGALSKNRLIEAMEREMKAAKRKGSPLSVVMIEALNIMEINQRFDRLEGDLSLAAVAMGAQNCLRDTDYLGRSGGLTFCALLPETNSAEADLVMGRIAETLNGIVRSHAKGEVHITSRLVHRTWDGVEAWSHFIAKAEGDLFHAAAPQ